MRFVRSCQSLGIAVGILASAALCRGGTPAAEGRVPAKAAAVAPPAMAQVRATPAPGTPNLYQLRAGALQVNYSTSGIDGKPHLHYQDAKESLDFVGDQIRTQPTEIGTLVSVTIRRTVDTGSTSFSVLVPAVKLNAAGKAQINTECFTTIHRLSPIPAMNTGQMMIYRSIALSGTASAVVF